MDSNNFHKFLSISKKPVVKDPSWIELKQCVPQDDEHFSHRTVEDICVVYQSPSKRYILDVFQQYHALVLYVADLLEKTVHRYETTKLAIDEFVGGYMLNDTHMAFIELKTERNAYIQHFTVLDHLEKTLIPQEIHPFPVNSNMDDHNVVASPLIIKSQAFCVLKGTEMFQFIPYFPKTNPFELPMIPNDFRIKYDNFRLENYEVQIDDATVCGSFMFMLIEGIYINEVLKERTIVDKMACIDLSKCNFEGTFHVNEHNKSAVQVVHLKKTNFEDFDSEELHYFTDANRLVYTKNDKEGRSVPYYVVDIEARTVTKINTSMSNFGFPRKYDNAVLQIRYTRRNSDWEIGNYKRRRKENTLENKIIRYNVPTLFQLCRDIIISTDLVKSLNERQKKLLF